MPASVTLKAQGLQLSPNQLSLPEGSLQTAENVVIRRDNVIEPTRGQKVYGNSFGTSGDRAKQLFVYKTRVLRHYDSVIEYDTGEDIDDVRQFEQFADNDIIETEPGLRIKSIEANGNFYFTTAAGIKKISAKDADDFIATPEYITKSGGLKALDLNGYLNITPGDITGFLPADSKVAYRVLWNIKDRNNYLIQGTPSERFEVQNSSLSLLISDFDRFLSQIDVVSQQTGSIINDNNYVTTLGLDNTASPGELRTNLIALAAKLDQEQGDLFTTAQISGAVIATGICTVTLIANTGIFDKISSGDKIWLSDFTVASGNINGAQTVINVTATTFTFSTTATGAVVTTNAEVGSGWFRSIVEPAVPSSPPTADEIFAIQFYMSELVSEIQSANNTKLVANNDGIIGTNPPLEILSVGIAGTTVTINRDTTGSFLDNLSVGDYVNLGGTWNDPPAGGVINFAGIHQVTTVSAANFTITISGLTPGTVTIATDTIVERITRFPTTVQTTYISGFSLTTTATVILNFTIPPDATLNHFYQVYRSSISQATGVTVLADLTADDEMQLVYEDFPTQDELNSGLITIEDITLDVFRGAFLYTNSISGEGLLQANDVPPLSKDIAIWRNYVFYSNTQTRHRLSLSLLGVSFLIEEARAGRAPKLVVATESSTNIYTFVLGVKEVTNIQVGTTALVTNILAATGPSDYFLINSAGDQRQYYVWYQKGTSVDPMVAGRTGIMITVDANDFNEEVALKTKNTLSSYINDFMVSVGLGSSAHIITITNIDVGYTTDGGAPSDFTVTVTTQGIGESDSNLQVLLSENPSAGIAVDITARSLVRTINRNENEVISAFYLSGPADVPGKMLFEGRGLATPKFYVLADTVASGLEEIGDSFSPILRPTNNITLITAANPSIITSMAHGLLTNDQIVIVNSNSTPLIDGLRTITRIDPNTFSIPVNVIVSGNRGAWTALNNTINIVESDNEISPNRVYYSKFNQPEAVPILNYIDLGPRDKNILRLAPLRDSLLVFKEDGLYRISGEGAPFSNELSDNSVILLAPDSLALMNNQAFGWTLQGVATISEAGTNNISRDIDTLVIPKSIFPNFKTITWGVGYESDNTYRLYTLNIGTDISAKTALQYNLLTRTWTTLIHSATCGIVNASDDKLYTGAGDINSIEQERKDFSRLDYSGREYDLLMPPASYLSDGFKLRFVEVDNIDIGDVLVQEQHLTVYEYNQLLKKLDLDLGINDPTYESSLTILPGDNLRTAIEDLATKLDAGGLSQTNYAASISIQISTITSISVADNTIVTTAAPHNLFSRRRVLITSSNSTPSINGQFEITVITPTTFSIDRKVIIAGTTGNTITINSNFVDISACYNEIIRKLNADSVVEFLNYDENESTTIQECIVDVVNDITKVVDVNISLPFIQGNLLIFKAIPRVITYSPIVFDDPLNWKHLRQATIMFENKNFTRAMLSFATDLLPAFVKSPLRGLGNGIFGHSPFGQGFFGGLANNTPTRTWIPRNCARCRFIRLKFDHKIAREGFAIFGITVVAVETASERAYKV